MCAVSFLWPSTTTTTTIIIVTSTRFNWGGVFFFFAEATAGYNHLASYTLCDGKGKKL